MSDAGLREELLQTDSPLVCHHRCDETSASSAKPGKRSLSMLPSGRNNAPNGSSSKTSTTTGAVV